MSIETKKVSNILRSVVSKNLIFDFANQYYRENDTIGSVENFVVDSNLYSNFVQFLNDKEYHYETNTEMAIVDLMEEAEEEEYIDDLKQEIEA